MSARAPCLTLIRTPPPGSSCPVSLPSSPACSHCPPGPTSIPAPAASLSRSSPHRWPPHRSSSPPHGHVCVPGSGDSSLRAGAGVSVTEPLRTRSGASFRDPDATLFCVDGRLVRAVSERLAPDVVAFLDSGFYRSRRGSSIVETCRADPPPDVVLPRSMPVGLWLEHDPIEFPTLPFEWPFSYLRSAALLTLDLLFDALGEGWTLKDGSATNVQFRRCTPVFVDIPSFVPYREDEPYAGYRQFCEHFLAPLLVEAMTPLDPRPWSRSRGCGARPRRRFAAAPSP